MTAAAPTFSLGLTYWPRAAGSGWWCAYDRGAVRDELAHVAALGCDTARFCLSWEDFQPGPQRLNRGALQSLEHALDSAAAAGLRVVAALFPVALGGALFLPGWANGPDPVEQLRQASQGRMPALRAQPPAGPPVLSDMHLRRNRTSDLFSDTRVLAAQRYLIRELVGYFGAHPALAAWQLGDGIDRIRRPSSAAAAHEWLATMAEAVRAQHAGTQVLGVVSAVGLRHSSGLRPAHVADTCQQLGVTADPPELPTGERPNHARWVLFMHALSAALGQRPALVARLGLPTAPNDQPGWIDDNIYGRARRSYLGTGEQQAIFAEQTLDGLQRAGASGAWFAAYADAPPALWSQPPLDRALRDRTLGLVDAAGREKTAAAVLRRFAAEHRAVASSPPALALDPERYWRAPARELARLWHDFAAE